MTGDVARRDLALQCSPPNAGCRWPVGPRSGPYGGAYGEHYDLLRPSTDCTGVPHSGHLPDTLPVRL